MSKKQKSVKVTVFIVYFLSVIFAILLFAAPFAAELYCKADNRSHTDMLVLLITFYVCSPSAALTLFYTGKLLNNIKKENVFTQINVSYLRKLSYCCLSVIPLTVPLCFFFHGGFPIPCSAGYIFFILRVIKNTFEEGTAIKNENDLTV